MEGVIRKRHCKSEQCWGQAGEFKKCEHMGYNGDKNVGTEKKH